MQHQDRAGTSKGFSGPAPANSGSDRRQKSSFGPRCARRSFLHLSSLWCAPYNSLGCKLNISDIERWLTGYAAIRTLELSEACPGALGFFGGSARRRPAGMERHGPQVDHGNATGHRIRVCMAGARLTQTALSCGSMRKQVRLSSFYRLKLFPRNARLCPVSGRLPCECELSCDRI